jgi:hypothetical protein
MGARLLLYMEARRFKTELAVKSSASLKQNELDLSNY